jgi:MFS family permease
MDISSEMVLNILPLYLANVLGVKTSIIGFIEGIAESTSSLLRLFSGWLSDLLGTRKWLAVTGYGISTLVKPFFYFATTWQAIAVVRWADRVGKGIRTAPRDALIADSITKEKRGLAFGFQRAADTGGAMLGLMIAFGIVWMAQSNQLQLNGSTFRIIVLASIFPAVLAVFTLAIGAKDVHVSDIRKLPKFAPLSLGRSFTVFMIIVGVFELGNFSDAFLILRAQDLGLSVLGIMGMLVCFNLVYSLVSTPGGALSDRIGRRKVIICGWLVFALVYLGFGLAQSAWQIVVLFVAYGFYYGLAYGTSKAIIADLVAEHVRGTAYGNYNAIIGILDFPASLIAGILWQGLGSWNGFGASAPFLFGSATALLAALLLAFWLPRGASDLTSLSRGQ